MTTYIFVGTYTHSGPSGEHREEGIYRYQVEKTGLLSQQVAEKSGRNPSFLTVHPNKQFLFSVNELNQGEVSAFTLDPSSADLGQLNHQPTNGAAPCNLSVDPLGRWLLSANYSGGSLAVHPIQADGRLGPLADFIQHVGTGPNHARQEKAHAHSIAFDPAGKFVICCDLGLDNVLVYKMDLATGKLTLHNKASAQPGAGPRHFAFHPKLPLLYVANELDSTVALYAWDGTAGTVQPLESWTTLPAGFSGKSSVADIHFHPNGKYLYVSNRGHDSLAIYEVDPVDGRLTPVGFESTRGSTPRNFAISPDGRFLYVANQDSDNIVCFTVDEDSGKLSATGAEYTIPRPVCLQFVQP